MDYNSLLLRLGLDPSNFVNKVNEPIKTKAGFIYEVEQNCNDRTCPKCPSNNSYVHTFRVSEINCSESNQITDILRVKKVRFEC